MIYLLRHGETVFNRQRRLQGQGDSPLTKRGEKQARSMGRRLRSLLDDPADWRLITSPLGRCRQTAALVAKSLGFNQDQIEPEPRLMEHAYGHWEGLTPEEIEARFPTVWRAREADRWSVTVPEGENYSLVATRVQSWLDEVAEEDRLIAVSHGSSGRILRGLYAGLPKEEVPALSQRHGEIYLLSDRRIVTYVEEDPIPDL
jgi:probable phosphoglycerate mutase